jgi:hypothetical protein
MHESTILEFALIGLALRGLILNFIKSIGDPLEDFDHTAILSRYVSVINWLKTRQYKDPFSAFVSLNENLGYWKVFICGYCLSFWLSIPLFYYYLCQSNLKTALIMTGIYFLTINKIK